jgi:sirohydrochlorin cobaltochelatase
MAQRGVLVIAHGSSKPEWVQLVDDAVSRVRLDLPVEVGYLEMVPGRAIVDAIQSLRRRGVDEIIAVPLFVSSGSTHIEEIGYFLGVIAKPRLSFEEKPIPLEIPVHYTPAMDGHPLIGEIVTERARKLSQRPEEEVVVLVGHGSEVPGFRGKWEEGANQLAAQVQRALGFRQAVYASLHPDHLHEVVRTWSAQHRVLVLPLFLSEGYFTKKVIPSKLAGLEYVYSGETYLPHPLISRWIEEMVRDAIGQSRRAPSAATQ